MIDYTEPEKEEVQEEFGTAKELVEEVLNSDPRARNSDLWLILMVWKKKQHIDVYIPYNQVKDLMSPETIRRVRQKIQNTEGKYPPTDPKVAVRRHIREEIIRKMFGVDKWYLEEFNKLKYKIK